MPARAGWQLSDQRVLGSAGFVERILREADARTVRQHGKQSEMKRQSCRDRGMQKERSVADGTAKREPPRSAARGHSTDRAMLGEIMECQSPMSPAKWESRLSGGFEDPETRLVQLVNNIPACITSRRMSISHHWQFLV